MTYVKCHKCETMVHYQPKDVLAFHKRFVEDKEPIYCFPCFKKIEEKKEKN